MLRRLVLLLGLLVLIPACASPPPTAPIPTVTPLPPGFSILPSFTPAYPCQLENVTATDDRLCRYERVQETIIADSDGSVLIQRDYHAGQGCWSGINVDTHQLRVCDRDSGQIVTLTEHLASPVIVSPDDTWFAFSTFEWDFQPEGALPRIHFFRVRRDGSDLQQLDTSGWPPQNVGASLLGWSSDGGWLELSLWDGTENGWYDYRLKTDGSGVFEAHIDSRKRQSQLHAG